MALAVKTPDFLTLDEFLAWDAPSGYLWQLVEGVPEAMAPPIPTHGVIQSNLTGLIRSSLNQRSSPCVVVSTPGVAFEVYGQSNFRIPDLAVTCTPIGRDDRILTDPVLLIEILSPGNQAETWLNAWAYTKIPSVQEIVVVRSAAVGASVLRRSADGSWPDEPTAIKSGELTFETIGFRTPIEEIYRGTWLAD